MYQVKWIGSSNSIKGALTQISVTLQPNADLLPGELVIISQVCREYSLHPMPTPHAYTLRLHPMPVGDHLAGVPRV